MSWLRSGFALSGPLDDGSVPLSEPVCVSGEGSGDRELVDVVASAVSVDRAQLREFLAEKFPSSADPVRRLESELARDAFRLLDWCSAAVREWWGVGRSEPLDRWEHAIADRSLVEHDQLYAERWERAAVVLMWWGVLD